MASPRVTNQIETGYPWYRCSEGCYWPQSGTPSQSVGTFIVIIDFNLLISYFFSLIPSSWTGRLRQIPVIWSYSQSFIKFLSPKSSHFIEGIISRSKQNTMVMFQSWIHLLGNLRSAMSNRLLMEATKKSKWRFALTFMAFLLPARQTTQKSMR